MKLGSLFSGIGGFELGLERAIPGLETVWQVEQNEFCQKVLKKHWPNAKIYDDVRNINKNNVEPVDILCGGFPCQDISIAGKGLGINEGKKSGLWWEMHRIISELRPRIAVMENVPAITFRGLDTVLGSLSEIGYDAEWCIISASQFGAPHLRKRWFCVAYPSSLPGLQADQATFADREERHPRENTGSRNRGAIFSRQFTNSKQLRSEQISNNTNTIRSYWQKFPSKSPICHRNDGIPNQLAKLTALGNAIVPQCSQWIGEQILNSGLLEDIK